MSGRDPTTNVLSLSGNGWVEIVSETAMSPLLLERRPGVMADAMVHATGVIRGGD
jgi:hypothetical protein